MSFRKFVESTTPKTTEELWLDVLNGSISYIPSYQAIQVELIKKNLKADSLSDTNKAELLDWLICDYADFDIDNLKKLDNDIYTMCYSYLLSRPRLCYRLIKYLLEYSYDNKNIERLKKHPDIIKKAFIHTFDEIKTNKDDSKFTRLVSYAGLDMLPDHDENGIDPKTIIDKWVEYESKLHIIGSLYDKSHNVPEYYEKLIQEKYPLIWSEKCYNIIRSRLQQQIKPTDIPDKFWTGCIKYLEHCLKNNVDDPVYKLIELVSLAYRDEERKAYTDFIYSKIPEHIVDGFAINDATYTPNYNFLESSAKKTPNQERIIKLYKTGKYKKLNDSINLWYLHPKKEAENYNRDFGGYFFHSTYISRIEDLINTAAPTGEQQPFSKLLDGKSPNNELCVSSFDSAKTFREDVVLVGKGTMRLLFEFDCYSIVDETTGLRYATSHADEYKELDPNIKSKDGRVKDVIAKGKTGSNVSQAINTEYYDEGFIRPTNCNFFIITRKDGKNQKIVKILNEHPELHWINWKVFQNILKADWGVAVKYLDSIWNMDNKHDATDDENYYKVAESIMNASFYEEAMNTHNGLDLDDAYNIISKSYEKSIGKSWSKEKFIQRAQNWDFYGDTNGFVAVRQQRSGLIKFVSAAGEIGSIMKGMNEVVALNKPMWGAATPKIISVLSKKYKFVVPPKMVVSYIFERLSKSGAIENAKLNDDGTITFIDPEVGEVVKQFFCNKEYIKWALENLDIPAPLKAIMNSLIGIGSIISKFV